MLLSPLDVGGWFFGINRFKNLEKVPLCKSAIFIIYYKDDPNKLHYIANIYRENEKY
jgi:hypothetical protein